MPNNAANINQQNKYVSENAQSKVPLVDLVGRLIAPNVLKEISEETANFYQFVPLEKKGSILEIGMLDPDDIKAREALKFLSLRRKWKPKIFQISQADFKEVIRQYRSLKGEVETALKELETKSIEEKTEEIVRPEEALEQVTAEAPITKIVAVVLKHAQEGRASDIHIEGQEDKVKVRFRVDGVLHTSLLLPKEVHSSVVSRIKILSNLKIDEQRIPQDGRFHSIIDNKKIDFRVSSLPTSFGEKIVMRLLDPTTGMVTLDKLGLTGRSFEVINTGMKKPFGMILMTGPTGSGKTTTLYAILNILNKEGVNIISLEDPIEYFIEGVNQSQIKPEIGYTFASGLRSILRQDPDIIMVGEIRDNETASLAVHAALTGHIVLSTLHTNNAIGVIPRLIDMGVEPFLLPASLNIMAAQRLVRRLCNECKKAVEPVPKVKEMIEKEIQHLPESSKKELQKYIADGIKIWQAPGCKYCAEKGTKGRIAIFEAFSMSKQIERIIAEDPSESKIEEEATRQEMATMRQDGIVKALQGLVSLEEILRAVEAEEEEL
ncbi:MAG: GspE/PulE family protein [Spirochaetota bacterium]|nr:GspE/PulE family protein [Spirochaetota bacterium]